MTDIDLVFDVDLPEFQPEDPCPACPVAECPEPECPIVDFDCPVPEACPNVICPSCEQTECEECLCDEYCADQEAELVDYIDLGNEVLDDDQEFYEEEEEEDEIEDEYLCDSSVENCRTSKGDRNTDTYDENYNAYYYYGYYYDYGYFSNYYYYDYGD